MTRRSAYDLRPEPGSIHWAPSDAKILKDPGRIAPWILRLRAQWVQATDREERQEIADMGERLQKLHLKAFGHRLARD